MASFTYTLLVCLDLDFHFATLLCLGMVKWTRWAKSKRWEMRTIR